MNRVAEQTVFKRYELKFMLAVEQKERVVNAMREYMELDQYGRTTIRNLYFDTDDYRLIRHSIEKPVYKEKLRVRSYQRSTPESKVYVELKKKYKKVVYKRRIRMPEREAMDWLCNRKLEGDDTQIREEIDYFLEYYKTIEPKVFLSYEREAYFSKDGSDFRVTFDDHILFRETELALGSEPGGISLLEEGKCLMEIKCSGGIPLWMTRVLTEEQIYKTSFSKYGTAYREYIFPRLMKEKKYGSII